jgi:hypothetical protein
MEDPRPRCLDGYPAGGPARLPAAADSRETCVVTGTNPGEGMVPVGVRRTGTRGGFGRASELQGTDGASAA